MQDFMEQEILPLGIWTQAANETQKWQWEIHSPGGQSHLLVFRSAIPHPLISALALTETCKTGDWLAVQLRCSASLEVPTVLICHVLSMMTPTLEVTCILSKFRWAKLYMDRNFSA